MMSYNEDMQKAAPFSSHPAVEADFSAFHSIA